ncbi:MAG: PQQ-binding-like beta-propeller repeat protein [Planctomycetes bacterium]|nr:PQQ-binding-like beta-propeller repeat protein [Planctomycetota bacterium]
MADLDLRALARAAAARPGDLAAGWAYATALARTGDPRGQTRELCRLARLGDADAQQALDAWSPWPGPDGLVLRRSLARAPRSLVERARIARVEGAFILAVARDVVLVKHYDGAPRLEALELSDGGPRWSAPCNVLTGALLGGLVVTAEDSTRLTARALDTGEVVAEATLPDEIRQLVAVPGGRAMCEFGPTFGLVDLTPEAFGERAWELPVPFSARTSAFVTDGVHLLVERRTDPEREHRLVDVETGATVWRLQRWDLPILSVYGAAVAMDARGLVVQGSSGHGRGWRVSDHEKGEAVVCELDARTRRPRWQHARRGWTSILPMRSSFATGEDVILVTVTERDGTQLLALERTAGQVRWSRALAGQDAEFVIAGDTAWLAEPLPDTTRVRVQALDLLTGAPRLDLVLSSIRAEAELSLAPMVDGVVLLTDDALIVLGEG